MKAHYNKIKLILTNPFNRPVHFNALRAVVLNFKMRYPEAAEESRELVLMLNLSKYQTNEKTNNKESTGANA